MDNKKQRIEELEDLLYSLWTIFDGTGPAGHGWSTVLPRSRYLDLKHRIENLNIKEH